MATLIWPMKASFVHYVSGAGGTIYVGAGAAVDPAGFVFPAAARDAEKDSAMRFRGTLLFDAHGGMLRVEITDPMLEPDGDGWTVSAYADEERTRSVPFATAQMHVRESDHAVFRVRLTAAGVPMFGGNYPVGAELDPMVVEFADRPVPEG